MLKFQLEASSAFQAGGADASSTSMMASSGILKNSQVRSRPPPPTTPIGGRPPTGVSRRGSPVLAPLNDKWKWPSGEYPSRTTPHCTSPKTTDAISNLLVRQSLATLQRCSSVNNSNNNNSVTCRDDDLLTQSATFTIYCAIYSRSAHPISRSTSIS
ncbi:hypothetical protein QR680_011293 [Steinernema hermaphroditum]|uniref:Uncharacterized protein n=1 Tax=Steinernema hermaphroditum TaxID=289476 RepID=A0AA39MC24_9BILA|nr:hypothetical protein QR680_011293 [Steinernema hermaphroditum]